MPARASDAFVERTFDSFAASFESKLERLSYRAPALVAAALAATGLAAREAARRARRRLRHRALRAPLVVPYARRLVGVDLSDGMLARAREKSIYDALMKAELTEFPAGATTAFDVIVSADALVYFGDLEDVLAAAAGALRPSGVFVFTLEHAVELVLGGLPAANARPLQPLARVRRTGARECGPGAHDRARGLAHGSGHAGGGARRPRETPVRPGRPGLGRRPAV